MKLGERAPAFNLPGVDGQKHTVESVEGAKATIIVFSCNHCPYVRMNEDRLIAIARHYMPKGVGMAFINSNDALTYPEDSFAEMRTRAQDKSYPFPYLYDETQEVARAYGASHTPHIFLFDRLLHLAYTGGIDDDDNYKNRKPATKHYLRDALEDLIAGRPVRVEMTRAIGCTIKWK